MFRRVPGLQSVTDFGLSLVEGIQGYYSYLEAV
jgi:hypothetical protein